MNSKAGFNIDRRKIELDQPLKTLGEFTVPIKLHKEVTVQITVAVTKQESEEPSA
jgi:large subunit ribosomal protein L9